MRSHAFVAALALVAGGCGKLRSLAGDPVGAPPDAASARALAPPPRGSVAAPAAPSTFDPHVARRGSCHRGDCDLSRDLCCENPSTGEEKCVARAVARGERYACSADGAWRIAMDCAASDGCADGTRCCIEQPLPGFRRTTCEKTCGGDESCTGAEGSVCATFGTRCLALPESRAGGHCVAGATAANDGSDAAPCAPCFGRNSIDLCVPLCADDQRCVDGECADE